ncbi:MAG TPA: hypothetical protein VN922_16575 [Bacteroidia bacterium]|nr:hypothetical protein [Bacteroidia bacterium]
MAEQESIDELRKQLEQANKKIKVLEERATIFEMPGKVRLYYSLNRNMNDLADMLNGISLKNMDITDPKDKTIERLKIIWASIGSLSGTISVLGESAGISSNEAEDSKRRVSFIDSIADKRY